MENKENKVSLYRRLRSNMTANVAGAIMSLMLLFGFIVCLVGNLCFTTAFKAEYSSVTHHMADSVAESVNGNNIEAYLKGLEMTEYKETKTYLQKTCYRLNVSLIYVIRVNTETYERFTNIFNVVNNDVDNTNYTPWELGFQRNTSNEEYKITYQQLYERKIEFGTIFRNNTTDGQHPHITTLVPIKNTAGVVTALLCMQRPIAEMEAAMLPYMLAIIGSVFVMGILITILASSFIKRSIIRPVQQIAGETTRFAIEKTKSEDLNYVSRYEDIRLLARSVNTLEKDIINYIDNLTTVTAERERIGTELNIAAAIQQNSLPVTFPAFPDRDEFDIYALMDPAKEVGGDFYNFFLIDDDHLALFIADVSGKGVPAALMMMVTNILLTEQAQHGGKPSEIFANVNQKICGHNSTDMFITAWLGILEISTGKLISANAGHEDPIIYRNNKEFISIKEKHGFVLGGFANSKYIDQETHLEKDDKIFLFTDGLSEATNNNDEMFAIDRILKSLNKYKGESPQKLIEGVKKEVNDFVGDADQFDDLTMMCLEIKK